MERIIVEMTNDINAAVLGNISMSENIVIRLAIIMPSPSIGNYVKIGAFCQSYMH